MDGSRKQKLKTFLTEDLIELYSHSIWNILNCPVEDIILLFEIYFS